MKIIFVLLPLICAAFAEDCSNDIFAGLEVRRETGRVTLNSSQDFQNAHILEFISVKVPILCENSIKDMPQMSRLTFESNELEEIKPGAFQNLPKLKYLTINKNLIQEILKGVFTHFPLLIELNLWGNKIRKIDKEAFDDLPQLEILKLSNNDLRKLEPSWFLKTPKIQKFYADYNQIKSIPRDAFVNFTEAPLFVWLGNNAISNVHRRAFRGVTTAKEIKLRHNRIRNLDDHMFAKIEEIDFLDLYGNRLTCFTDEFLSNLRVKEVKFDGNPIDCNVCLWSLIRWADGNNVKCNLITRKLQCP